MRHGYGVETFHNGERYAGQYLNDRQEGRGSSFYSNGGLKYVGEWRGGNPHGNGTFYLPNGMRFEGEFLKGQMGNRGTLFNADGSVHRSSHSQGQASSSTSNNNNSNTSNNKSNNNNNRNRNKNRDRLRPKTTTYDDKRPKGLIHTIGNIIKSVWPFSEET